MTDDSASPFHRVREPSRVVVLTARACPRGPLVVAEMRRLSAACGQVSVEVVDIEEATDLMDRLRVRSVPAIVVDDDLCLEGTITAERVAGLLAARGGRGFEAACCRLLLEHGRAQDVAMRVGSEANADAVSALLVAPELSIRMGAQLAVREASAQRAGCAALLLPKLIRMLSDVSPEMRGDLVDLLGAVGDRSVIDAVRGCLGDDDEDVREAAQDAIAELERRGIACC